MMQGFAVKLIGCLLLALMSGSGWAQVDSVLSPKQFYTWIIRFHPLVKQAKLYEELASQELRMNRGAFDPKAMAGFNRKSFDGKEYYNLLNPELKIPTWSGLDVKAGFERNVGPYVSDEHATSLKGLQYLGVSVPLGQGLLTDARRTTLKQAKIGLQLAAADRIKQVNKILFSAAKEYWDWYFNAQQVRNAELAYRFANERYQAVKERIKVGEQAPIDSVEAHIFQQDRQIFLGQSRYEELNSRLQISSYLWNEAGEPVELLIGANPGSDLSNSSLLSESQIQDLIVQALAQHPGIVSFQSKLQQLELERKLGKEMLKPNLQVNYNWLSQPDQSVWSYAPDRNYKFGVDFGFPLLLRKERGKLGLTKTKIFQTQFELIQARRDIEIQIRSSYNDLKNLDTLIRLQQTMVNNYQKLRDGEIRKFENGESSLFLINSRESKLLEAQIKQANLVAKFEKELAQLLYSSGKNVLQF